MNYDPDPDKPYATCSTCGEVHQTREDMNAHHKATTPEGGGSSHSARISNRSRPERIHSEIENLVESAMYDLMEELDRLVSGGNVSEDEITEAVRSIWVDVADDWKAYLNG